MNLIIKPRNGKKFSDITLIEGIQQGSRTKLEAFFRHCSQYFYSHCKGLMASVELSGYERARDKDDLFAESFECLWTEIENKRIFVREGKVWRLDKDGVPCVMTSSLTSFLMSIAKNKCREQYRDSLNDYPDDFANVSVTDDSWQSALDLSEKEIKIQIIDDCLNQMHKRCKEILTMFYVMQMSLDEILVARDENVSKDGLKTGKYKCMNSLKASVRAECKRRGINI